jgi:CRP/FNR family transcriptional regulator, dissimilatory nitrate respiration regulator
MALESKHFSQLVIKNTLRSCQLFVGLPAADIEAIASFIIPKHLSKGDYLFREGDLSQGFYIIQKGAINVHRVSATGKEQVIHVFYPIESFAEAALATEGGYPADARATESSMVLLVPKKDFVDLLRRRPEFGLRMLGSMSQHLRVIVGLLDDLTLKDMETRVANWLLKHCPHPMDDHEVEIKLDRTKRVLAAEFGATSETLSRTLAKFRDKKLLRLKGNAITITQPLELARVLQRHLGEL